MKKKILLGFFVIGILLLSAVYFFRNKSELEISLTIKNELAEEIEFVGIFNENKLIMNKTNEEEFYFPKNLTEDMKKASILVVSKAGDEIISKSFTLSDQEEIVLKEIQGKKILLNIEGQEMDGLSFPLPNLENWTIEEKGDQVVGSFSSDTDLNYQLFILGKGGKLGMSDTESQGEFVDASWDKTRK